MVTRSIFVIAFVTSHLLARFIESEGIAIMPRNEFLFLLFVLLLIMILFYRFRFSSKRKKNLILLGLIYFVLSLLCSLVRSNIATIFFGGCLGLVFMMDDHRGWTSLFESDSGGNSVGSSEESVNQPAPGSPEPVAPAAPVAPQPDGGGPLIPELGNPLMPVEERMIELGHRLLINSISKPLTDKEWGSIVAAQATVEERIEAALVHDGVHPDTVLAKRHQIRGFLFYPGGTRFEEQTYVDYVRSIDNEGVRACVPYKRVIQAVRRHNLSL